MPQANIKGQNSAYLFVSIMQIIWVKIFGACLASVAQNLELFNVNFGAFCLPEAVNVFLGPIFQLLFFA